MKRGNRFKDLSGRRYGRIVVLKFQEPNKFGQSLFSCNCDCGRRCVVLGANLTGGHTKSCGCLRESIVKSGCHKTHGLSQTPEYQIWNAMKQRSSNKNVFAYKNYGGRGIKVCKRWSGKNCFINFYKDMGKKPVGFELERINNNIGYIPSNCKWASIVSQANNKRATKRLVLRGQLDTLPNFCRQYGASYTKVRARISKLGWTTEEAFQDFLEAITTPEKGRS